MKPAVRVRFAPSPTGYLHIGGARTALYSWAYARRHGGTFVLRIEDTDQSRLVPGAATALIATLERFGLVHDGPIVTQSERLSLYQQYAEQLIAASA